MAAGTPERPLHPYSEKRTAPNELSRLTAATSWQAPELLKRGFTSGCGERAAPMR
jgi:hypothetical protein